MRTRTGIAALGAAWVLVDPRFVMPITEDISIFIGGEGFSADLKGAVVTLILIGGFTAVKEYWLGSSAGSEKKTDAITRIAELPDAAAGSSDKPLKTGEVHVDADTATVNTGDKP